MTFICIQRDSRGRQGGLLGLMRSGRTRTLFHLSVQPPQITVCGLPMWSQHCCWALDSSFLTTISQIRKGPAETQRTTSHTMVSFNFFSESTVLSPQPMHPLFLFHWPELQHIFSLTTRRQRQSFTVTGGGHSYLGWAHYSFNKTRAFNKEEDTTDCWISSNRVVPGWPANQLFLMRRGLPTCFIRIIKPGFSHDKSLYSPEFLILCRFNVY